MVSNKKHGITFNEFVSLSREINGNRYEYIKFEGTRLLKEKVEIICKIHGIFSQKIEKHLRAKQNCPKCAKNYKLNTDFFIKKAINKFGNKYIYDKVDYKNAEDLIIIGCKAHGYFTQKPGQHLYGTIGCNLCKIASKSNNERFIHRSKLKHGDLYDYSKVKYVNKSTRVCIICKNHGDFWQTPHEHLAGCGCQKCRLKSQTLLFNKLKEKIHEEILFEIDKKVVSWIGKQRFDIYFPKYNITVEYNGEQHYRLVSLFKFEGKDLKKQQERDKRKRKLCKENNCFLFEVKYDYTEDDFKQLVLNINNIINNFKFKQNEIS